MKRIFWALAAVAVILLVAFSISRVATESSSTSNFLAVSDSFETETAGDERILAEINKIWQEHDRLKVEESILAKTRPEDACGALSLVGDYQALVSRYDRGKFQDPDLITTLSVGVTTAKVHAVTLGYQRMKASLPLGCGGSALAESYFVNRFDDLMDTYGSGSEVDKFDRTVVQSAYLRAVVPEIEDAVTRLYLRPDDWALEEYLQGLIREAQNEWHLSLDQLKVPNWFRRKIAP